MSGWRAGVVALVVGGLVLLTGWLVDRPPADGPASASSAEPAEVDTGGGDVDDGLLLACVEVLMPACGTAGAELGVGVEEWHRGDPPPERGVIIAPAGELPDADVGTIDVAASPVVVAGWLSRWQPLELDCGGAIDVQCLADRLDAPWSEIGAPAGWGQVTIGLADPTTSEAGMLAWSLIAPALGSDAGGATLADALRISADDDAELMEEFVRVGDSRANFVVTTEAAVLGQFQNAIGRGGRLSVAYPEQSPWMEYRAAGWGRGSDRLLDGLMSEPAARALTQSGVRPAQGLAGDAPEGMGDPGERMPVPDETARGTLTASWEDLT